MNSFEASCFSSLNGRTAWGLAIDCLSGATVIGDPRAVFVSGNASTLYAFPGGFDVNNFYMSCPQVRVGSWKGTEAVGRLIFYNTGDKGIPDSLK